MSAGMAAMPGQQQQEFGNATLKAGTALSSIAADMQKDVNEAEAKTRDTNLMDSLRGINTQYLGLQAGDAVNAKEATIKAIDQAIKDNSAGLQNDMQRKLYDQVAVRRRDMALNQIESHNLTQSKVWKEASGAARLDASAQDAIVSAPYWNANRADLNDLRAKPGEFDMANAGKRHNSEDNKGVGYLGLLKVPGTNDIATEYTIDVEINGKEKQIPTLVPTLTKQEVVEVLGNISRNEPVSKAIEDKAVAHAQKRIAEGKDVFFDSKEKAPPNPYATAKATVIEEALTIAEGKGFARDTEAARQFVLIKLTDMHGKVVNSFLAADKFDEAKKYYTANEQEINPEKRSEFVKTLDTAGTADASIKLAQTLSLIGGGSLVQQRAKLDQMLNAGDITPSVYTATMQGLTTRHAETKSEEAQNVGVEATSLSRATASKGDLNARLRALDNWYDSSGKTPNDVAIRDQARTRVTQDWQTQKAQQAEGEKSLIGGATDWFVQNPGKSILDFQKANPAAYLGLKNTGHLAGVVGFSKGNKVETDPATWADVMTNMSDLKTMTPTDIYNKYSLKVSEPDLNKLYSINNAMNGSKDEQHLSIMSNAEMVKDSAVRMGILPASGKPGDSQTKSFNEFQGAIDQRISSYESSTLQGKRKASQEELKKILQEVEMDKVYKSRSIMWDKADVPIVTMKADELQNAYVMVGEEKIPIASIPAAQRVQIIPALKSAGYPITEKNIASFWVRGGKKQ
jgi:hypothetical protein